MLTPRGWWMLLLSLTIGVMGGVMALRGLATLLVVCSAIVLWYTWEWVHFYHRARVACRRIQITRSVADDRGSVGSLWAGQSYSVLVKITLPYGRLPFCVISERPPTGATIMEGDLQYIGEMTSNQGIELRYRMRCDGIGVVRFEGVRLRLADYQGFFYFETFVRNAAEFPALPALTAARTIRRGHKRFNLLPPPGVHRFRRPGTGSELLELRDYRPGDPPKRIAWKVSARRDELITREFESEVPLRCTLLVDASAATRLGPVGDTALTHLCRITAAVAQAAITNRDLVGLALCTDDHCTYLPPARTSAHLITILTHVARAASLQPQISTDDVNQLIRRAHALANDVYPDVMAASINSFPAWIPWMFPRPGYVVRPRGGVRRSFWLRLRNLNSATIRRRYAWRKRLAALLTAKYMMPSGALALMLEDDGLFAWHLQQFLAEHRVSFDLDANHPDFADCRTLDQQTRALIRSVSRGRDNELFVLLGDYTRRSGQLTGLLKAVRTARSRHHQVLVVQTGKPASFTPMPANLSSGDLVNFAQQLRSARAWQATRRAFGRLGVPIASTDTGDAVRLILHRLEELRMIQGASRR